MTNRVFTFDLGRIMDEAFKFAESFGETFDHDAAEKMRQAAEQFGRGPFGNPDYYPAYMYPPADDLPHREKKLVLELALAGFEEKDICVQFRGDHLLFSAKAPRAGGERRGRAVLQAPAEAQGHRGAALLRARRQVRPGGHAGDVPQRPPAARGARRASSPRRATRSGSASAPARMRAAP